MTAVPFPETAAPVVPRRPQKRARPVALAAVALGALSVGLVAYGVSRPAETAGAGPAPGPSSGPTGSLWVDALVPGAVVWVGADSVGLVPTLVPNLGPGTYRVSLRSDGAVADTVVRLAAGEDLALWMGNPWVAPTPELGALVPSPTPPPVERGTAGAPPETGEVRVVTRPAGAVVRIDGREVGRTPLTYGGLGAGRRTVSVALAGHEGVARVVDVRPGTPHEVDVALRPTPGPPAEAAAPGTLQVLVQPWGTIYVDGEVLARETDVVRERALPPGEYRVRAEHPTFGTHERVVRVRSGDVSLVVIDVRDG